MNYSIDQYYKKKNRSRKLVSLILPLAVCIFLISIGFVVSRDQNQLVFIILLACILSLAIYYFSSKKVRRWHKIFRNPFPKKYKEILEKYVDFYLALNEKEKVYFEQRIQYFLLTKTITGVDCDIDDRVRIFIAASAVMPVFSFPDFIYNNINEILVYPDSFDENFAISNEKERKKIAGMVGNGIMNRMMILSKKDLLRAFDDKIHGKNVAVHEFVHLIDMADGSVDGIPKILMERSSTIPWISQVHREMKEIFKKQSDIDPYAVTDESEFLAVVSEYFFDAPDKFEERHPGLYESMANMFKYKK